MPKQSAIDYLIKELSAILGPLETKPMQDLLVVDAINKAKQMEKEQQFNITDIMRSLPSDDVPLMIWANVYNPIKTDSWDLHHTEASAVKNSIGAKTHCYIHESLLGNDR